MFGTVERAKKHRFMSANPKLALVRRRKMVKAGWHPNMRFTIDGYPVSGVAGVKNHRTFPVAFVDGKRHRKRVLRIEPSGRTGGISRRKRRAD